MKLVETYLLAAFEDTAQIASLMYVSRILMLRVISPRTPPRSWKHTKRRKRGNILSHVLSNVVISLHSWSPPMGPHRQGSQNLAEEVILYSLLPEKWEKPYSVVCGYFM
jgi:hypothetical protein